MTTRARACALGAVLAALVATPAAAGRKTVRLTLGPFPVEARRDREVCQAFRIRGVPGMEITSSIARSRVSRNGQVGSHHLVAYGYRGADAGRFPSGIVDSAGCAGGFGPDDFYLGRVSLAGSGGEFQSGRWTRTAQSMPGDLAQVLPNLTDAPGEAVVVVNSHYFNVSDRAARGLVKVKLRLAPLDPRKRVIRQVIHTAASRDIRVPPGGTGRVSAAWQADGAWNPDAEGGYNPAGDVCVWYLASHMHKRGVRFTIDYEGPGGTERLLDWPDYLHAGLVLRPPLGGARGLLRAHTAENGFPRIRYECTHANGAEGREVKMGCQEEPGVTPGLAWAEAEPLGISALESHATPCGLDGANCDGAPCVPANLVFGPLSDDEMCILAATVYDPLPGVPPERACDVSY
jgi:hypothetical protein